jgi:hypothetical protein
LEAARQKRESKKELFAGCKRLQAAGLPMSQIALRLGLNRRRLDKWAELNELPERKRMTPRPGSIGMYRDYLRQRWDAGYRNGQMLFDEIKSLGFVGTHKTLNSVLSPWRVGNQAFAIATQLPLSANQIAATEAAACPVILTDPTLYRQISPQVAAALLAKPRPELTSRQREIVSALKASCPGYTTMRNLTLGFRRLMKRCQPESRDAKGRKLSALRSWIEQAKSTAIVSIQNFACQLERDILAVEAAVTEKWSNGIVEGLVNRLKTLKRQMYGRASVELLRARLMPLALNPPVQRE